MSIACLVISHPVAALLLRRPVSRRNTRRSFDFCLLHTALLLFTRLSERRDAGRKYWKACRCAAVSEDAMMAYVALADEQVTEAAIRKSDERRFMGSIAGENDSFADGGGPGGEGGVCGYEKEGETYRSSVRAQYCR